MKEIKAKYNEQAANYERMGLGELGEWLKGIMLQIEELYEQGFCKHPSNDLICYANGYVSRTGYDGTMWVYQTYDLRSVNVRTKATARKFAEYILER